MEIYSTRVKITINWHKGGPIVEVVSFYRVMDLPFNPVYLKNNALIGLTVNDLDLETRSGDAGWSEVETPSPPYLLHTSLEVHSEDVFDRLMSNMEADSAYKRLAF